MAEREIVGRCTCPICGLPSQDVRVNINQKLYGYCDNGCAYKFNSAQSRKFLPDLRAGKSVATSNGLIIISTKGKTSNEVQRPTTNSGNNAGNTGGINADGRTTGNRTGTGSDAGNGSGQSGGRRPWVSWLTDGDDDDDD